MRRTPSPSAVPPTRHLGGVIPAALLGCAALGLLAWAGWESSGTHLRTSRLDPVDTSETSVLLTRAGLTPSALAAAGLSPQQAAAVVADARDYLASNIEIMRSAESNFTADRDEVNRLEHLVRSGQAEGADLQALAAARGRMSASAAARQAAFDAMHNAGAADLTPTQRARLSLMRGNSAWDLPQQYLAVDRNQEDRVLLRAALADTRIAAQLGAPPDPASAQVLLDWNAQPDVANAASALSNLPAIQAAWSNALNSPGITP